MQPRTGRFLDNLAAPVLLLVVTLALAWCSGALHSEFGRYQDEGMHYITGLFIQDYLTSGHWSHPMAFALNYYLHFPKVALGNWPPGFSLMQVAWALVFGVSRLSMLCGMIVLTAWLAWLVYREATPCTGRAIALVAAIFALAAPLTQSHTAMVMAEIPLAAVSLLAILAAVRFVESARTRDAVVFALWTSAAIMIKGNGWAIVLAAPLIVLAAGRARLFANYRLWLATGIVAVLCAPYTLFTMRIVSQGWDTRSFPGFAYLLASLGHHLSFVANILGIPLTVIALIGMTDRIVAFARRDRKNAFWIGLFVYAVAIVVFHVAIPSSIEPRKIYQILPVMCLFAAAGLDAIARLIPTGWARTALAAAGLILFGLTGFSLLPEYAPGFGPAVENLIARSDTKGAAILIASNPQWEDAEAAIISEWASRDRRRGVYLIRATKLLSHPEARSPAEADFVLDFRTGDEMRRALDAIPIGYVLIHTTGARASYPHHELLRAALRHDPADWELVYRTHRRLAGLAQDHDIEIYRSRKPFTGVPVRYSADLSNKLGALSGAGQPGSAPQH